MGDASNHAITQSKLLRRYSAGPSIGYGSRRNKDRVVSAVWSETGNSRFAGYIERDGRLEDHRIIEGVRSAVAFLEGSDEGGIVKKKVILLDGPYRDYWQFGWNQGDCLPPLIAALGGAGGQVHVVVVGAWPWQTVPRLRAKGWTIYRKTDPGYVVTSE
jgi:hypothetical protein